jgi:trigger factor
MIPGFEDGIIGKEPSEFSIKSTFPEDYFKKDLAGIEAEFKINLKTIQELHKSIIGEDLYKKLEMDVKTEDDFKNEISSRMAKEVKLQEKDLTKESIYETLLKTNSFSVPKVTVKEQADLMRKDALMRIGQTEENGGEDLFPIDTFMENAEKRVKLDLLFAELIKHFEITADKEKMDIFIEKEAEKYKDSEQFKQWVQSQPQQLDQYRMIVLEEQLIENLEKALKSKDKVIEFSELANK